MNKLNYTKTFNYIYQQQNNNTALYYINHIAISLFKKENELRD